MAISIKSGPYKMNEAINNRLFEGYEIEFPFGPAAGAINGNNKEVIIEHLLDVIRSPAGFAKFGSLTWSGGLGNPGRVYYHDAQRGITGNAMGLPNVGSEEGFEIFHQINPIAEAAGKPLIPSFSPGKGEDPLKVLPTMAGKYAAGGAKIIEVNYSCRNKMTDDGQGYEDIVGFYPELMFEIDEKVIEVAGTEVVITRKLPPYIDEYRKLIPEVVEWLTTIKGKAAMGFNSIGGQEILDEHRRPVLDTPGSIGSLSGSATAEVGISQQRIFRARLPARIAIFTSLGITTGEQVFQRVDKLGADFAEGVTVFTENEKIGKSYGKTIAEMAYQYENARFTAS